MADKPKPPSTNAPTVLALGEPRPQCGVIPYCRAPNLEVMLVTSRETGRWVIPKGGLMPGGTPWEAAAQEAFEEAGVIGDINEIPLGAYDYVKFLKSGAGAPCRVTVYAMAVTEDLLEWPEMEQRTTKWFGWSEAAAVVHETGLKALIHKFGADFGKI